MVDSTAQSLGSPIPGEWQLRYLKRQGVRADPGLRVAEMQPQKAPSCPSEGNCNADVRARTSTRTWSGARDYWSFTQQALTSALVAATSSAGWLRTA